MSAAALISQAGADDVGLGKRPTGMDSVDWVFDGGLPRFGVVLLCAREGAGKTSFLWELLSNLARKRIRTLYLSSEQSLKDLGRQFARCGAPPRLMEVGSETDFGTIQKIIEHRRPQVAALDSVHDVEGVTDENGDALSSGSPRAVTRIIKDLRPLAEELELLVFAVAHVSNDGTVQGGANLRHAVDAVLGLDRTEDEEDPRRFLAFRGKTRFGPLGRRGLLLIGEEGLKDAGRQGGHASAVPLPKKRPLSN